MDMKRAGLASIDGHGAPETTDSVVAGLCFSLQLRCFGPMIT